MLDEYYKMAKYDKKKESYSWGDLITYLYPLNKTFIAH